MSSVPYYQLRRNVANYTLAANWTLERFCAQKKWSYSNTGYDSNMGFNITVKGKRLKEVHLMPYLRDFVNYEYTIEEQDDKSLVIKFTLKGNPLVDFYDEFHLYFWTSIPDVVFDYCKKEKLVTDHTIGEIVNKVIKSRKKDHYFVQFREYAKIVKKYLKTKEENLNVIGVKNV